MEKYNVRFKKKFGQNFLKDVNIVKKIVNVADISGKSLVIEVGPGGAIMTRELALVADYVLAYEIDNDLQDELNKRLLGLTNVDILFKDFLQADILTDISKYDYDSLYFVSNVPYYITTPIILKLMNSNLKFKKIVMMVQQEVGERFSMQAGSREYGSISVILQYYYDIKIEFKVSRKEFIPVPNVDSVIISFSEKNDKLDIYDFNYFDKIVRDSFRFKRKNIKNNLSKYNLEIVSSVLNKFGLSLTSRAEEMGLEVFVNLANELFIDLNK